MPRKPNPKYGLFAEIGLPPRSRERKPKQEEQPEFDCLLAELAGAECITEFQFHPSRKWRFDYALPSLKIAVEVEGGVFTNGRHVKPLGFLGDMEKYNAAAILGWLLIRTTPEARFSPRTLDTILAAIRYRRSQLQRFAAHRQETPSNAPISQASPSKVKLPTAAAKTRQNAADCV